MNIKKIQLNKISFHDNSYSISPEDDKLPEDLSESIARVGILNPPIVKEKVNGKYLIINGRKRLNIALNQLHSASCNCQVIPASEDELSVWAIALESILQERQLTPIEKGEFFKKVINLTGIEETVKRFLPIMGHKAQIYFLKQFLPLAELEEHIKAALQAGKLDHNAALSLSNLSFRNRLALFELIEQLQLSFSNQKKIISICVELEKRHNIPVLSILSEPGFLEISQSQANLPQKAANIMKYLIERSQPRYTEALNDYNTFVKRLHLPNNVQVAHSQAFETDNLAVKIDFKNRDEFIVFWERNKEFFSN